MNVPKSTLGRALAEAADNADEFVRLGQAKAADLAALVSLREQQRQQILDSPLLDAQACARQFEAAVRGMWQRWCDTRSQAAQK